jgi:hypothetical protein
MALHRQCPVKGLPSVLFVSVIACSLHRKVSVRGTSKVNLEIRLGSGQKLLPPIPNCQAVVTGRFQENLLFSPYGRG